MNSGKKPSRISILQEYQSFKNINPLSKLFEFGHSA